MSYLRVVFLIAIFFTTSCGGEDSTPTQDNHSINTANVPVFGGTVELTNVARVVIPPSTFTAETLVQIKQEDMDQFSDIFDEFSYIFSIREMLGYGVMVTIEKEQPSSNITVDIVLPQSFIDNISQGMTTRVFVGVENESDLEEIYPYFELVVADTNFPTNTITFEAEPSFFSKLGTSQENFFGLFTVGTTPGKR